MSDPMMGFVASGDDRWFVLAQGLAITALRINDPSGLTELRHAHAVAYARLMTAAAPGTESASRGALAAWCDGVPINTRIINQHLSTRVGAIAGVALNLHALGLALGGAVGEGTAAEVVHYGRLVLPNAPELPVVLFVAGHWRYMQVGLENGPQPGIPWFPATDVQ